MNIATYEYNKIANIDNDLKSKIEVANYIIITSQSNNLNNLKSKCWSRSLPEQVINLTNKLEKPTVLVSVKNPYDVALYSEAKAKVLAFGFKGMDPTECKDENIDKSISPNIPAVMSIIFGAKDPVGKLPIDIPNINKNGDIDVNTNYYFYDYGLTNLTNKGDARIKAPDNVYVGEEFSIKLYLKGISSLKSDSCKCKLSFNNSTFKLKSIKSLVGNLEVSKDIGENNCVSLNFNTPKGQYITDESIGEIIIKVNKHSEKEKIYFKDINIIDDKKREFYLNSDSKSIKIIENNNIQ